MCIFVVHVQKFDQNENIIFVLLSLVLHTQTLGIFGSHFIAHLLLLQRNHLLHVHAHFHVHVRVHVYVHHFGSPPVHRHRRRRLVHVVQ